MPNPFHASNARQRALSPFHARDRRVTPTSVASLILAFGIRHSAFILPLLVAGCVSQDDARKQAQAAYQAGFREGQEAAEAKRTQVFFEGPVQRQQIFWHPDLTLAQAIVEAVYTSPKDPKSIVVTRNGTPQLVDPKNLLRGVDFLLEPGDVVDLIP
jgi:hypothetical protein